MALVATLALAIPRAMSYASQIAAGRVASAGDPVNAANSVVQPVISGLEDGACVAFAPSGGHANQTVFLDAGHGGLDPGVVGTSTSGRTVLEKDAALAVASRLAGLLRGDGYSVVMARTRDTTVLKLSASDSNYGAITSSAVRRDLAARAACANASGADALISIHFDAFTDPLVGGTETFYNAVRPFAAANRRLAMNLQSALVARLGADDRGVWTDDQIAAPTLTGSGQTYNHLIELGPQSPGWVDNPSEMPGALVEPLFMTNRAEAQIASDPTGQQSIAEALEAGVMKFFTEPA